MQADLILFCGDRTPSNSRSTNMNMPAKDIKQQLNLIIDRRNKIAHEADIDPSYPIGNRWPIDEQSVNDAIEFLEKVVESIHNIL